LRQVRAQATCACSGGTTSTSSAGGCVLCRPRIENRGTFPFTEHALAALNGVVGPKIVDLDRDGDLDIVAVAFVPDPRRADQGPEPSLPSLVWLEQVAPGRFERHTLEVGGRHVSVDAADYDRDGDVDLVVGNFGSPTENWVEVWENLTVKK